MSDEATKPPKRPYTSPRLVTYGDVTTLTQARPAGAKSDKGGQQKSRTG